MIEPTLPIPREMAELIADGARRVRESDRDEFFKRVADLLRPLRDLRPSDVHHAIGVTLADLAIVKDRNERANV